MYGLTPEQTAIAIEYQNSTKSKKHPEGFLPTWAEAAKQREIAKDLASVERTRRENDPVYSTPLKHVASLGTVEEVGVLPAAQYLQAAHDGRNQFNKHNAEGAVTKAAVQSQSAKINEPKVTQAARLQAATTIFDQSPNGITYETTSGRVLGSDGQLTDFYYDAGTGTVHRGN